MVKEEEHIGNDSAGDSSSRSCPVKENQTKRVTIIGSEISLFLLRHSLCSSASCGWGLREACTFSAFERVRLH